MPKYVGEAKIVDPILVTAKLATMGSIYDNGGIFCTCPELGFEGLDMLYCRYGLSIPYCKVSVGDTLLIEPTIGKTERWFYTGYADSPETPITTDQVIFDMGEGTYKIDVGTSTSIKIDSVTSAITLTAGLMDIKLDGILNKVSINGTSLVIT